MASPFSYPHLWLMPLAPQLAPNSMIVYFPDILCLPSLNRTTVNLKLQVNSYVCECPARGVECLAVKSLPYAAIAVLKTNKCIYRQNVFGSQELCSHWDLSIMQRTTWERPESPSVEQSKNLDKDLAHLLHEAKASPEDNAAVQDDADKAIDQISKVSWITSMVQKS